jgi:hypothetical protein
LNCFEVQQNLVAFLQDELESSEMMKIHKHLGTCERCLTEEKETKKTLTLLDKYPYFTVPSDFEHQLFKKIKNIKIKKGSFQKRLREIVYPIAATILIIFGLELLIYLIYSSIQPTNSLNQFRTTRTIFKPVSSVNTAKGAISNQLINRYLQKVRTQDSR